MNGNICAGRSKKYYVWGSSSCRGSVDEARSREEYSSRLPEENLQFYCLTIRTISNGQSRLRLSARFCLSAQQWRGRECNQINSHDADFNDLIVSILPRRRYFLYINSSGPSQSVTDQTVIRYELRSYVIWKISEKCDDGRFN